MTEGILLDTNVLSETRKPRPHPGVVRVLSGWPEEGIFISVLTLGELRRGVEVLRRSEPATAAEIGRWVDETQDTYQDRTLPVTAAIAQQWGLMSADRSRPVTDTLIAATARTHGLTVVTRNRRDFADLGIEVIDPWTDIG